MKPIHHPMLIVLALVVIVLMAVGIEACAKTMKAPKGRLLYYDFHIGGGMNPFDETIYHLRYEGSDKVPTLTVSGPCEGERITFEVSPEVFDRCAMIIRKQGLYRSKGYYKEHIMALDAPSASFSLMFEGADESVSGSGDWPKFVSEGVSVVNTYLRSLVGDRKPEGHVDRIYGGDDLEGMHWTDGTSIVTTTGKEAKELKLLTRQLFLAQHPTSNAEKTSESTILYEQGFTRFHDGDQHYIVIHDYQNHFHRLFYSFDGSPEAMKKMVDEQVAAIRAAKPNDKGRWDIVNERFLSHPMLKLLTLEQLRKMKEDLKVIRLHDDIPTTSGPWKFTDIAEVNNELLEAEIGSRGEK